MPRPTVKTAAREKAALLALTPARAPLLGEPVEEAPLPELVLLAVLLDRDAEAPVLVADALPEDLAVVAPAPAVPVDDEAAVELAEPPPTVDPLTMESATLLEVLLCVM